MNWKKYEKEIHDYFSKQYPGSTITYDAKIVGRYSKIKRQIDILIEDYIAGIPIRVAIDAKYFSKRIDVKDVESFISMLEDINVHQGILITNIGYSDGAINRAHFGPTKLDLDILNFQNFKRWQGVVAVSYAGNNALLVQAPLGWIVDANSPEGFLASLYQRGLTLKGAMQRNEWMYLNFFKKEAKVSSIDDLKKHQHNFTLSDYTNLSIENLPSPTRRDEYMTGIQRAKADQLPNNEITGYIDCGDFISFFVLFTSDQLLSRNIRKLHYVLMYSQPGQIEFDNDPVIKSLLKDLNKIKNPSERGQAFCQLGIWSREMNRIDECLDYHRQSYKESPKNYKNIKWLIISELQLKNWQRAIECSIEFFKLDPHNPRVMQDLLEWFYEDNQSILPAIVDDLSEKFSGDKEALGNIFLHFSLYQAAKGNQEIAMDTMKKARGYFKSVFKDDHYVFQTIRNFLNDDS